MLKYRQGDREYTLHFRPLDRRDAAGLASFFQGLSPLTRSRFGPHPLDEETARGLCTRVDLDSALRFVLVAGGEIHQDQNPLIIGYFILNPEIPGHEAERYRSFGIQIESHRDCMFAPCLADPFQGKGLASQVIPLLLDQCRQRKYRSLVLLGGTRETNPGAIQFYRKFGFRKVGGYYTDVYNMDMQLILNT